MGSQMPGYSGKDMGPRTHCDKDWAVQREGTAEIQHLPF